MSAAAVVVGDLALTGDLADSSSSGGVFFFFFTFLYIRGASIRILTDPTLADSEMCNCSYNKLVGGPPLPLFPPPPPHPEDAEGLRAGPALLTLRASCRWVSEGCSQPTARESFYVAGLYQYFIFSPVSFS